MVRTSQLVTSFAWLSDAVVAMEAVKFGAGADNALCLRLTATALQNVPSQPGFRDMLQVKPGADGDQMTGKPERHYCEVGKGSAPDILTAQAPNQRPVTRSDQGRSCSPGGTKCTRSRVLFAAKYRPQSTVAPFR